MTALARDLLLWGGRLIEAEHPAAQHAARGELYRLGRRCEGMDGFAAGALYVQAVKGFERARQDPAAAVAWLAIVRQIEVLVRQEMRGTEKHPSPGDLRSPPSPAPKSGVPDFGTLDSQTREHPRLVGEGQRSAGLPAYEAAGGGSPLQRKKETTTPVSTPPADPSGYAWDET